MSSQSAPEIVTACRKAHFNATHRLHNPDWDDEKNERVFGKCNNENYHGHNYNLTVKVTGPVGHDTGYVIDLKFLSDLIKEHVEDRFDHKNLYLDVDDFKHQNPTAENIAIRIWHLMRPLLDTKYKLVIELFETERNYVEYTGPAAI